MALGLCTSVTHGTRAASPRQRNGESERLSLPVASEGLKNGHENTAQPVKSLCRRLAKPALSPVALALVRSRLRTTVTPGSFRPAHPRVARLEVRPSGIPQTSIANHLGGAKVAKSALPLDVGLGLIRDIPQTQWSGLLSLGMS